MSDVSPVLPSECSDSSLSPSATSKVEAMARASRMPGSGDRVLGSGVTRGSWRETVATVAPIALIGVLALAALRDLAPGSSWTPAGSVPGASAGVAAGSGGAAGGAAAALGADLRAVQVVDSSGATVPLVPQGGGVLALVSSTCGHCHASMQRLAGALGTSGDGSAARGIRVVMIEGTTAGLPVARRLGLTSPVFGPSGDPAALMGAFRAMGTPMFVWVDDRGRVRDQHLGEITGADVVTWAAHARGQAG